VHELAVMCLLINQSYGCLALYLCAGVCVSISALVLCGHDVWFLGRHTICAIFCVLTGLVC
jgi:uncharacterized membrane protein YfbV (UPF0208 family)